MENLRLLQLHTKVSGKNSKNQKIFFKGAKSESELDLFADYSNFDIAVGAVVCVEAQLKGNITVGKSGGVFT